MSTLESSPPPNPDEALADYVKRVRATLGLTQNVYFPQILSSLLGSGYTARVNLDGGTSEVLLPLGLPATTAMSSMLGTDYLTQASVLSVLWNCL